MGKQEMESVKKIISKYMNDLVLFTSDRYGSTPAQVIKNGKVICWFLKKKGGLRYSIYVHRSLGPFFLELFAVNSINNDFSEKEDNIDFITHTILLILVDKINEYYLTPTNQILMTPNNCDRIFYQSDMTINFGKRFNLY